MNKKELIKILNMLGLTDRQSEIYLVLLKGGIMSVLDISRALKINRTQVYEDLNFLVSNQFVDLAGGQRKKYIPAHPAKLEDIAEERKNAFEKSVKEVGRLIPEFERLIKVSGMPKVSVKYHSGIDGLKNAYENELRFAEGIEVLSIAGSLEVIYKKFPENYWYRWNKKFVKQKSKSRMMASENTEGWQATREDKKFNRQTRLIKNFEIKLNIDIYDNSVLIVSPDDLTAVVLEGSVIAYSFRVLFETLWKMAK